MGFRIFSRFVVIAGLVFGLLACGGGGGISGGTVAGVAGSGAILQYILVTPGVPPTLSKGATQQFVATGYYSDGTWQTLTPSVTWNSSTPAVASINGSGQAAGLAIGSTNITAAAGGVTSLPVTLYVMQARLTSIAITSTNPPSMGVGQSTQYTVTGTYSDGFTQDITPSVLWYGRTGVADVNTMYTTTPGLAIGVAPGAATITANIGAFTASASLTVTNTYAVGGTLSLLPAGSSITLSNTVTSGGTTTTDSVTLNANGSYYFPVALAAGSTYDVKVSTNIATPHPCTVVDGSGTISATTPTPVTSVQVVCGTAVGTLAGSSYFMGGAVNGTGTAASFNFPKGVTADAMGNVYVADSSNSVIRKITPAGVVTTLAGTTGTIGYADGPAATAKFWSPTGVAVDTAGNVYVADSNNNMIRKITPAGAVSTLAGTNTAWGFLNGTGTAATFNWPQGIAVDTAGNVYVADTSNHAIRKITPVGVVSTLAGTGTAGSANGAAASATFSSPYGVAVDAAGNVYVADTGNHLIRKIAGGQVTTFAGSTLAGAFGGFANGTGTSSMFDAPMDVAVDGVGNVYVADAANQLIRLITPNGVVTTLAGTTKTMGSRDGPALSATFTSPKGVAVDSAGNVYVSDENMIRKVTR